MSQPALTHTIDHLKKDVQYLMDRLKTDSISATEQARLQSEKKEKIKALKNVTSKLREVVKQERATKAKAKEISHASRVMDSLEFQNAKSQEAVQKVRKARAEREVAKQQYTTYIEYEKEYNKHDPPAYPGYLFLSEQVLDQYGPCPFIKMDIKFNQEDMALKQTLLAGRKEWLASQADNGKIYNDLYEKLVVQNELKATIQQLELEEASMLEIYTNALSPTQIDMWETSCAFAEEYVKCTIKTKRIKERYKTFIHTLSILYAETNMAIHEYLATKWSHPFVVNDVGADKKTPKTENADILKIQGEMFLERLDNFNSLWESKDKQARFINNKIRNLKHELYLYLTGKKNFQTHMSNTKSLVQAGKYFKRWTALTTDEKNERFYSFSDFHVERCMVLQGIISRGQKPDIVAQLTELLQNAYNTKRMIYRDFRWITKRGVIDDVKVLRFTKETSEFHLAGTAISKKKDQAEVQVKPKSKKKPSQRTIITKENSEVINEQILLTIIEATKKDPQESMESIQEACVERVRDRLLVKKITNNDKKELLKIVDEMFKVVTTNTP